MIIAGAATMIASTQMFQLWTQPRIAQTNTVIPAFMTGVSSALQVGGIGLFYWGLRLHCNR